MASKEKIADLLLRKQYIKEKSLIRKSASILDVKLTRDQMFNRCPHLRKSGVELPYTRQQIWEIKKCHDDPHYFINNYCYIVNLDAGLVKFSTRDYQDKLINLLHNNKRVIVKFPRQSGKTVTTAAYATWEMIFRPYSQIAILANKAMTAKGILQKVRLIYESLPVWLQVGVVTWNKSSIELENGSRVEAAATSSSAIRSMSISTLIIDECAFVDHGVWGDFYASVYPTVSSSKKSKIFLISTPKGMNHFYKFWMDSVNRAKTKSDFANYEIQWNDVPDRDEKFRTKVIAEFGKDYWLQEFECEFLGSAGTLINTKALKNMAAMQPVEVRFDGKLLIYELPVKKDDEPGSRDSLYAAIVDVGEGTGNDYSTIQVFDVTSRPFRQVAVYRDNLVTLLDYPIIIEAVGKFYNNALMIVESNSVGEGVLNDLVYDLEYENVFFFVDDKRKSRQGTDESGYGIRMTALTKRLGNSHLKRNIEDGEFVIVDETTIGELTTYVRVKTSYEAEPGKNDDTVTPLVIFSYFLRNELWVDQWLDQERQKPSSDMMRAVIDDLLPIGFVSDGDDISPISANLEDDIRPSMFM